MPAYEVITLPKAMTCAGCGQEIPAGSEARYYSPKKVYHFKACPKTAPAAAAESYDPKLIDILGNIATALYDIRDLLGKGK
jgi:hypothetical protein